MDTYTLSKNWFEFSFENPEKVKPIHSAIYFFAIDLCNRLGWKEKFGLPSQMVMESIGVKNWKTYSKGLKDLVDFGFIEMIEVSKNQYTSNIIAIVKNTKATTKALAKATAKHSQSTVSINKPNNHKTKNEARSRNTFKEPTKQEVYFYLTEEKNIPKHIAQAETEKFWNFYESNGWRVGKNKMKKWKPSATNWVKRSKDFAPKRHIHKDSRIGMN